MFIRLPEADIQLVGGKVAVTPVEVTPERELVANAMLAAGAAVAVFAVEHDIPMPFGDTARSRGKGPLRLHERHVCTAPAVPAERGQDFSRSPCRAWSESVYPCDESPAALCQIFLRTSSCGAGSPERSC